MSLFFSLLHPLFLLLITRYCVITCFDIIVAANLAPHNQIKSFKEEKTLGGDINNFLSTWHSSPGPDQLSVCSSSSSHAVSMSDNSCVDLNTPCVSPSASCPSPQPPINGLTALGESSNRGQLSVVTSDYGSEGIQTDGMYLIS